MVLLLLLLIETTPAPQTAQPASAVDAGLEVARAEVQRTQLRLQRVQDAFDQGAVASSEVAAAELALNEAYERFERLAYGARKLTPEIAAEEIKRAEERIKLLRDRHEKLRELFKEGAVARRDLEAALETLRDAGIFLELARIREVELQHEWELARRVKEWEARGGKFDEKVMTALEAAYQKRFAQALPVSALGMTHTHLLLNFNHEGRADIALHPDSPEGRWLIDQLALRDIPFLIFRGAVPGKATGAHIHLGLRSPRLIPAASRE